MLVFAGTLGVTEGAEDDDRTDVGDLNGDADDGFKEDGENNAGDVEGERGGFGEDAGFTARSIEGDPGSAVVVGGAGLACGIVTVR